ncbi:tyrosine-type recombinase/integrase [Streptomyces laurentii]|uniref:tyrosine-type recombinase/integrase n=1 Tax=Streptomyces laurentii TaxID=39478 RepID=UPI0036B25B91
MARKNPNGAGTISLRKDGRYEAKVYVPQPDGTRARKTVYGKTWEECDDKRLDLVRRARQNIPTPTKSARLSEWLPTWLDVHIRPHRKHTTIAKYEMHVRLYLVPKLGTRKLETLSTADVRRMVAQVTAASSAATAKEAHRVLRTALAAAQRDELIARNVASLVPPPQVTARQTRPWTAEQTVTFLAHARKGRDPLYAALVLSAALGLRRGEVLGLRWTDIDFAAGTLTTRSQLQRANGRLYEDTTKNRKVRTIPLPRLCVAPLRWQRLRQTAQREAAESGWADTQGYVFTTKSGRPIEPRNYTRTFTRLTAETGLPAIRLHDVRHGTATLLAAADVPPRVIMAILGHSQIAVTMNVYTHVVDRSQREAMDKMDGLLAPKRVTE